MNSKAILLYFKPEPLITTQKFSYRSYLSRAQDLAITLSKEISGLVDALPPNCLIPNHSATRGHNKIAIYHLD